MALHATGLTRLFKIKKGAAVIDLPDPNPSLTPEDVIRFYSGQYPELTNCTVNGPKTEGGFMLYEFSTTVGTKG